MTCIQLQGYKQVTGTKSLKLLVQELFIKASCKVFSQNAMMDISFHKTFTECQQKTKPGLGATDVVKTKQT